MTRPPRPPQPRLRTARRRSSSIADLHKSFGGIKAVNGATFDVAEGSITALIGPNGAGKTTLFNLVTGFYRPDFGAVTYRGESIFGRSPNVIARRGMVRTFQITKALAAMPVIDNMLLAAPNQPGEHLPLLLAKPLKGRRRESEVDGERARVAGDVLAGGQGRRLRRHAVRRPAQVARAGTGPDDRAANGAAGRADGRDQPHSRQAAAGAHGAPSHRAGRELPLRRARHGGRDEPLRPGGR